MGTQRGSKKSLTAKVPLEKRPTVITQQGDFTVTKAGQPGAGVIDTTKPVKTKKTNKKKEAPNKPQGDA